MSLLSVDEARTLVLALAGTPDTEEVALEEAAGRVLARDAVSAMTQPPFDAAAMDGYAVRAADLPGTLAVVAEAAAGRGWDGTLRPGQAARIFTGAPVPAGADTVMMQEHARRDGDRVIFETASEKTNIRLKGNDFSFGETLPAGCRLTARDIALLAAMNVPRVTVACAPRVAVLAGGDELVRPGQTPQAGQIISSNDLAVAALVREAGGVPRILPLARDTRDSLNAAFAEAAGADLIVTIGGASVGDHDLIAQVAADLGMSRAFHRIAMRPGKPLMAGRLGDNLGGAAMLGLPGNPVSAFVTAVLFMQPLIRAMQGDSAPGPVISVAALGEALLAEGDRQHYLRARLDGDVITAFTDQDSARLRLLAQADALLIRPAGDPARAAGERITYIALPR